MKNSLLTKKLTLSVILLSLALILGYIEAIFPMNIGQIGLKIGLSNIITLLGLEVLDIKRTIIINILRLVILGVLFGNLLRFTLSVAGFILSFLVMLILLRLLNCSIIFTSICGGVAHNVGQFMALAFIMKNINVLTLLPIYILVGVVTGAIVGVITYIIYKKIIIFNFY